MTLTDVMSYLFAQTSQEIFELKKSVYRATEHEKYAYVAPDKKSFRNKRPSTRVMDEGWVYEKVKFVRTQSHINPKHPQWTGYRHLKRRANVLLAARLILKAGTLTISGFNSDGIPVDKSELPLLIPFLFSQAGSRSAQKRLAGIAYRVLLKMNNRLKNQPERFTEVSTWLEERQSVKS